MTVLECDQNEQIAKSLTEAPAAGGVQSSVKPVSSDDFKREVRAELRAPYLAAYSSCH